MGIQIKFYCILWKCHLYEKTNNELQVFYEMPADVTMAQCSKPCVKYSSQVNEDFEDVTKLLKTKASGHKRKSD